MDNKGLPFREVLEILKNSGRDDSHFEDGKILGSMFTEPHEISRCAHAMFWEANLGNPGLCPGAAKLEREAVAMLARMVHGEGVGGYITSGGTEANITGIWLARKLSGKKDLLIPKSAHFSLYKAADILGMNPVEVELDENYRTDLGDLERKLKKSDAAAVVGIAGTTEFGAVDPIEKMAEVASDTFLHVDAAFGGFVLPFLDDDRRSGIGAWDFSVNGVSSMTIDPNKMGLSTTPSGAFLVRDEKRLERIKFSSPYLTSDRTLSMLGTRASASAVSSFAVMKHLGQEGYRAVVSKCMQNRDYMREKIEKLGVGLATEPTINILGVVLPELRASLKLLEERGWKLSVARNPECLRIIVMPHVTRDVIDCFINDLEEVLKRVG